MLATSARCQFEVDRGPDWLLVRVRRLQDDASTSAQFAERLWQLLEQHFTYRLMLELDQIVLLNSTLIGQLIQLQSGSGSMTAFCGCAACRRITARCCTYAPWRTGSGPMTAASRRSWAAPIRPAQVVLCQRWFDGWAPLLACPAVQKHGWTSQPWHPSLGD